MKRLRAWVPLLILCPSARLPAQPTVKITSPKDGAVVSSGRPLVVTVDAAPAAFQGVVILGDGPIGSDVLKSPPYRFEIPIPPQTASRRYTFVAVGILQPGGSADSDPVTVDIERPDDPARLMSALSTIGFDYVGHYVPLIVTGVFSDGSHVDLTRSTRTTYVSDTPAVATVDANGVVTGVRPGSARITIRSGGRTLVVPVTVANRRLPAK